MVNTLQEIRVPDIGDLADVTIIELAVKPGDTIAVDQTLLVLESEKATMDVPAPLAGQVKQLHVKVGDKVSKGSLIASVEVKDGVANQPAAAPTPATATHATAEKSPAPTKPAAERVPTPAVAPSSSVITPVLEDHSSAHASPMVRRLARELGVNLNKLVGSGPKQRILESDVKTYVKQALTKSTGAAATAMALPAVNHAKFGAIEAQALSRIQKISGQTLQRNWQLIPHVTQHDEADITDLEAFRQSLKSEPEAQNLRLTPLVFVMKALVKTLQAFPTFNASLSNDGTELILKKYYHLGVAVDTPDGLVVPVIRNVDQKTIYQLASELAEISARARAKKLLPEEMQGSSFTISSLGGIGGTAFTPIINWPDVAILGLSRHQHKPVWQDGEFVPHLLLPLSLSYDHRVIDGALAARFIVQLGRALEDIRRILL